MLLVGADPELFLKKDSKFFSAHTMIPGTKIKPHPVNKGAIQLDGVAAEFNIIPATTKEEFVGNLREVIKSLATFCEGYELVAEPTAYFDKEYFENLPDEVKILGCMSDYSAYTGDQNPPPATSEFFRTGAGHIHLGYTEYADIMDHNHVKDVVKRVRQLDTVLYIGSLLWDKDVKRRELYGTIGSFRPKQYGLEYRPLSNAFLSSDELCGWVFDASVQAMKLYEEGVFLYEINDLTALVDTALNKEAFSTKSVTNHMKRLTEQFDFPELKVA